jgi:hypothetical protein
MFGDKRTVLYRKILPKPYGKENKKQTQETVPQYLRNFG